MKLFFLIAVTSFVGCSVASGPIWYAEPKKKEKIVLSEYSMKDTLYLKYFSMGTWLGEIAFKKQESSQLDFNVDTVWQNVISALNKTNLPFKISERPSHFEIPDWYYQRNDSLLFKEHILRTRMAEDADKILIIPIIGYSSSWKQEINAGLTFGSISPSGMLEHSIAHTVSICVIKGERMFYFSGIRRGDTLTRDPSEPYRYHFPQELWDTLMYMSTRDYVERMR